MDSNAFDRLARAFSGIAPRRNAVQAAIGAGIAASVSRVGSAGVAAKKKRKRRCRKPGERCGGKHKCCDKSGPTRCATFDSFLCSGVSLGGRRCCGQEGARCDPTFGDPIEDPVDSPNSVGNCSCCEPLYCGEQPNGQFRCQEEDT
jgi:hypothetical protein